ncbi:MAG TPA: hypothetical protein ENM98_01730 [Halothiobacillaceae bacterium]|nr:hypothetical protein [Halothiobacillaceae bacterium]
MRIDVALEWFLNPDHLPFIIGIEQGWFAERGMDVFLNAPEDHYDGLAGVVSGEMAFACNEPLHMVDEYRPGLKALGTFFETRGGIMLTPEGLEKLKQGQTLKMASPVSGEITDELAAEIIERYIAQQDWPSNPKPVEVHSAGFEHLTNLQSGFDAAWLCFYNFEGIEAAHLGLETLFLDTSMVDMANFSALELFTGAEFFAEHPALVANFIAVLSQATRFALQNPQQARELWYKHTKSEPDALTDAIINDTCTRFISPVVRDESRWLPMYEQLSDLGLAQVTRGQFADLYRE